MRHCESIGPGSICYEEWGSGSRPLVCVHGYSNTANLFQPLARKLSQDFTLYSIELPHHGQSDWPAGKPFTKAHLKELLERLLDKHPGHKLALAGFSLGGRVALCALELLRERIAGLALVAPDGLGYHPAYRLATQTGAGRLVFSHLVTKPSTYQGLLQRLYRLKLVDRSRYHFAQYFIQTEQARLFLKNVWLDLRLLMPKLGRLRKTVQHQRMPIAIWMGRHDHIIPPRRAEAFARGLPTVRVAVLDKGHRLMDGDTFEQMAQFLRALPD